MGNLMIVNGSPRAPRSNFKQYAEIFKRFWKGNCSEYMVTEKQHANICEVLENYIDLLLVFPLYADGLPVLLMHLLKEAQINTSPTKPTVHVLISCGFLKPEQNPGACDIVKLFCKQHGFPFGSVLQIGGGEAILTTPFAFLAKRKMKQLANAITKQTPEKFRITLPLSKRSYLKASTKYWIRYGEKYGVSKTTNGNYGH